MFMASVVEDDAVAKSDQEVVSRWVWGMRGEVERAAQVFDDSRFFLGLR
jgi:hypothetical protein